MVMRLILGELRGNINFKGVDYMMNLGEKFIRKSRGLSNSTPLSREARETADSLEREFRRNYGELQWFDTENEMNQYASKHPDETYFLLEGEESLMKKKYCLCDPVATNLEVLGRLGGFRSIGGYRPEEKKVMRYAQWF